MAATIDDLIALSTPEIQKIFLKVMQDIVDEAVLKEMIEAIENNDVEALYKASGFTPAALAPIVDAIERTYYDSAVITADGFPSRIITPAGSFIFRFDIRNPVVEQELKLNSGKLISAITEDIRNNIRTTMERGQIAGSNPRKTALDIVGRIDSSTKKRVGGVIGLTTNQEKWTASTQRYLKELDNQYFTLTLRDKRFDKTVAKAIEENKQLDEETMSKLLTAYKSRALKYRAEAISRTEVIQSINRGEYRAHKQMVEETGMSAAAVTKLWDDVGDGRERTTHLILGQKYGKKGIQLDEAFDSPSGAKMLHPGDTSLGAGAEEIVHCRCKARYKVDWFAEFR